MEKSTKFTNLQLELLKLYSFNLPDEELMQIRRLLANYFYERTVKEADRIWDERGYSDELMSEWLKEKS